MFRLRNFHSFYYQFYLGLRCLSSPQGAPPGAMENLPLPSFQLAVLIDFLECSLLSLSASSIQSFIPLVPLMTGVKNPPVLLFP